METAPKVLNFDEFIAVSFYEYLYLNECILKGMKKNIILDMALPDTPPTKAILVGRFHHTIMEYIYKAETISEFHTIIENEIDSLQQEVLKWHYFRNSGSVRGWIEINKSASFALRAFKRKTAGNEGINAKIESSLISKDKILIGRPDLYSIHDSIGILKELKSSSLLDSLGNLKTEYHEQILFYSILLFDNFEITKVEGSLESLHGEIFKMIISRDEAEKKRELILANLAKANEQIRGAKSLLDISAPSNSACRTCAKKLICNGFKKMQMSLDFVNDEFVIDGTMISVRYDAKRSISELIIYDNYLNMEVILKAPESKTLNLNIGCNYIFSGLSFVNGYYTLSDKTRIYCND